MRILRLAYVAEFFVAVIAVFVVWDEVGGQSHLDMMPWYLKLALGVGAALAAVKATVAAVERDRAWNSRSVRWFGILLALLFACGVATYYYHLLEVEEQDEEDQGASVLPTALHISARLASARRLERSAPSSATTMRSPSCKNSRSIRLRSSAE